MPISGDRLENIKRMALDTARWTEGEKYYRSITGRLRNAPVYHLPLTGASEEVADAVTGFIRDQLGIRCTPTEGKNGPEVVVENHMNASADHLKMALHMASPQCWRENEVVTSDGKTHKAFNFRLGPNDYNESQIDYAQRLLSGLGVDNQVMISHSLGKVRVLRVVGRSAFEKMYGIFPTLRRKSDSLVNQSPASNRPLSRPQKTSNATVPPQCHR